MADINETSWSPNRKVVAQAAAMLVLFITGATFLAFGIVIPPIPLGIETALAVVLGYLIPNKSHIETSLRDQSKTTLITEEVHDQ